MKVRFIINSHAGRSGKLSRLSEAIRKVLKDEAGIFEVKAAMDREHAARLSSDAAEKGYEVVFACGGDGAINNIDSALPVDGSAKEGRPLLLTAANTGHFGGNAVFAPDARMDDGLLDFAFVPRTSFFSALGLGLKLFRGKIASHKGLRLARGKEAEIKGWNLSAVHVDGEPFEWRGDVEISVLPGKIRVLTP